MSLCTVIQDVARPQISMPNQGKGGNSFGDAGGDLGTSDGAKTKSGAKPKVAPTKQDKAATTGWFGGIWGKLAMRPKNQMKLPDDKNPTVCMCCIVYLFSEKELGNCKFLEILMP